MLPSGHQCKAILDGHAQGCRNYVGALRISPQGVVGPATFFKTSADLVGALDLAVGSTNALVVFEHTNPPLLPNGPDWSLGVWGQFIDLSP